MSRLKSRIGADILRDQGAPKGNFSDEQRSGTGMDFVDRGDFPEVEDISAANTPDNSRDGNTYSGIKRKNGQLGTT